MRAAQFTGYGGAEHLRVALAPRPAPGPGEVLVRVHASSVNGGELLLRAGRLRLLSGRRFPKGLGSDLAGTIAAAGEGVSGFTLGDRVWGVLPSIQFVRSQAPSGAAAEFVCVPADKVGPLPNGLGYQEAAALPTVATTALTAIRDHANVQAGQRVLVRGAADGLGTSLVQLAAARGGILTALAGAGTLEAVRGLGAAQVLDYRTTTLSSLGEFDVILDTAGSQLAALRRLLAPGGRMIALALNPPVRGLLSVAASAVHGSRRIRFFSGNPDRGLLADLAREVSEGRIHAVIDQVHPLEQVEQAHRAAEAHGRYGKQVISICDAPQ